MKRYIAKFLFYKRYWQAVGLVAVLSACQPLPTVTAETAERTPAATSAYSLVVVVPVVSRLFQGSNRFIIDGIRRHAPTAAVIYGDAKTTAAQRRSQIQTSGAERVILGDYDLLTLYRQTGLSLPVVSGTFNTCGEPTTTEIPMLTHQFDPASALDTLAALYPDLTHVAILYTPFHRWRVQAAITQATARGWTVHEASFTDPQRYRVALNRALDRAEQRADTAILVLTDWESFTAESSELTVRSRWAAQVPIVVPYVIMAIEGVLFDLWPRGPAYVDELYALSQRPPETLAKTGFVGIRQVVRMLNTTAARVLGIQADPSQFDEVFDQNVYDLPVPPPL